MGPDGFDLPLSTKDKNSGMNYWIVCITDDNLRISLTRKIIGFAESKRAILKSFQPGDLVIFYVSR